MRRMIIDTDTASDDAVAILMALRHPDIDVIAITIVSGNMTIQDASRNALYVVELCGRDTKVYIGCERPLIRCPVHAYWYHGKDGMGDQNYPPPILSPSPTPAVDALISLIQQYQFDDLTIVTLGPLTNLAMAVSRTSQIAKMVKRVVVMGGAAGVVGNVTPAAEYNIWCDPEAARVVFRSGFPLEMVGWEVGRGDAALSLSDISNIYSLDTKYSKFAMDCNQHVLRMATEWQGDRGMTLHDPTAMAIAIDPSLSTRSNKYSVDVEVKGELTRGMTVVDTMRTVGSQSIFTDNWVIRQPNVLVHHSLDAHRWKALLRQLLS